jgi:apolipoprotein N-acyltransferase
LKMQSLRINNIKVLFIVTSGILLFLSFPKYGVGIIAWVALVPLLFTLKNASTRDGLIIGFITGLIYNIGVIYWIIFVVVNYGYLPFYIGFFAMLLLAAYLSVYIALFAMGVVYFTGKGIVDMS